MTEYLVYIETKGDPVARKGPVAHVPALPGAAVRGRTIEEAKAKIKEAVVNYLSLLREAGEPVPVPDTVKLQFGEAQKTTFPSDYTALGTQEMEMLLRWLAISRQELVNLVKNLPAETLDWKPDEATMSVHEILYQIAEADLWYTDRLKRWPESALSRLAAARGVALERLRSLDEAKWNDITIYDDRKWNPRKVIRRMLENEREQIEQIQALLAAKLASQP
jgi:predicted RNase H-like HicB family nuclease/uncharacterized damage-inducible protein DinB